ncbi:MAG TPA: prolyl-tRNA synthetase associated domain-containing protein [Williamwhitmania sp.]|nr:prolyl-tRNA synthetase associated domain-containing protein [Williamwhitmania sp.]
MNGSPELYTVLSKLNISFDYYEHPPTPTVEEAMVYWKDIEATHCKNLFFRNHKGNRHYLVVFDHRKTLEVKMLEEKLRQGKLSFASAQRMETHLGVTPGSVTPLAIINDAAKHVKLFLDMDIERSERVSFHPCINTASIVIQSADFIRFLDFIGNEYEWIEV